MLNLFDIDAVIISFFCVWRHTHPPLFISMAGCTKPMARFSHTCSYQAWQRWKENIWLKAFAFLCSGEFPLISSSSSLSSLADQLVNRPLPLVDPLAEDRSKFYLPVLRFPFYLRQSLFPPWNDIIIKPLQSLLWLMSPCFPWFCSHAETSARAWWLQFHSAIQLRIGTAWNTIIKTNLLSRFPRFPWGIGIIILVSISPNIQRSRITFSPGFHSNELGSFSLYSKDWF